MEISYSIIIPHYNIPDLLMRCLKSIPVREDVQVIVVDDCSPDADTYLERYPELSRPYLEFYSTEKGGSAGRARNVGLKHAKGKWLIFADADDFFSDSFERLLDECIDREEDMLFFNYYAVDSFDITTSSYRDSLWHNILLSHFHSGEYDYLKYQYFVVWGRMFSRTCIEDNSVTFGETRYSNDCMFSVKAGHASKTLGYVDEILYVVTERDNSLTSAQSYSLDAVHTKIEVGIEVTKFWDSVGFKGEFLPYMYYVRKLFLSDKIHFLREMKNILSSGTSTAVDLTKNLVKDYGVKYKAIAYILHCLTLGYRLSL